MKPIPARAPFREFRAECRRSGTLIDRLRAALAAGDEEPTEVRTEPAPSFRRARGG